MVNKPTLVGIGKGRNREALQHRLTDRPTMPGPSTMLAIACFALLSSCAATVPVSPPIAEPPAKPPVVQPPMKPASDDSLARLTVAERAARHDMITQQAQPTPRPSSTIPGGRDYQDGYPQLAQAPKARADGSLQSFLAINTGPYVANSITHNVIWTNNSGRALAIHKAYLWSGVDKGAIADVHVEARRTSDNSYIGILQWDHYADPTLPQHGQQFDYTSPMMLDPGETITILHFANGFTPGWHARHALILWVK